MEKIKLEDLKDKLNISNIKKQKPNIVIVATRCSGCDEIYPFIFSDQSLYMMTHYMSWHQYLTCPNDGSEVSVYSGHGDIVYNPYNHEPK